MCCRTYWPLPSDLTHAPHGGGTSFGERSDETAMAETTRLEFRIEDGEFRGFDPDNSVDYRISYVGNGCHSHYWLQRIDAPQTGLYVYDYDTSDLRQSIYDAERRLVFGVEHQASGQP